MRMNKTIEYTYLDYVKYVYKYRRYSFAGKCIADLCHKISKRVYTQGDPAEVIRFFIYSIFNNEL